MSVLNYEKALDSSSDEYDSIFLESQIYEISSLYEHKDLKRDFMNLKGEKLMIFTRDTAVWDYGRDFERVYMRDYWLTRTEQAVENYFDLMGWINRVHIQ